MTDVIEFSIRRMANNYEVFDPQIKENMIGSSMRFEIPDLGVPVERGEIIDVDVGPHGRHIDVTVRVSRAVAAFMIEGAGGRG